MVAAKTTTVSGTTALAGLTTDVSVSSPSNRQLLMFSTYSLLNKWTPYTLTVVAFNDSTKTITVTGATAFAGLTTDVAFTTLSDSSNTTWTNSNLLTSLKHNYLILVLARE